MARDPLVPGLRCWRGGVATPTTSNLRAFPSLSTRLSRLGHSGSSQWLASLRQSHLVGVRASGADRECPSVCGGDGNDVERFAVRWWSGDLFTDFCGGLPPVRWVEFCITGGPTPFGAGPVEHCVSADNRHGSDFLSAPRSRRVGSVADFGVNPSGLGQCCVLIFWEAHDIASREIVGGGECLGFEGLALREFAGGDFVEGDRGGVVAIGGGDGGFHFSVFLWTFRASPGGSRRAFPADEKTLPRQLKCVHNYFTPQRIIFSGNHRENIFSANHPCTGSPFPPSPHP